jgi:hypothetical protein
MTLTIVNEDDCSTIDNRGTRITDREKLETKKREKLRSEKSKKKQSKINIHILQFGTVNRIDKDECEFTSKIKT